MKKFGTQFTAYLTGKALQKMYAILDNEEKPYSMTVSKARNKLHTVTLKLRTEDAMYFAEIIDKANIC